MSETLTLEEAVTEHLGCYHNDYDECGAHSTWEHRRPWPCDVRDELVSALEDAATCETDPEGCDIADEACCDGCASGLGPCYGPGIRPVCHNEVHVAAARLDSQLRAILEEVAT